MHHARCLCPLEPHHASAFPVAIPPRGLAHLPVTSRPNAQGLNIDTLIFVTNDPDNLGLGPGLIPALFRANGQAASSVIE